MKPLKLAGVIHESIVDGPGIRFVVFAQGCPHHCLHCHNPQTWAFEGGQEATPEQILALMKKNPLLKGITLSGGEPFCQSEAMGELAALARSAGYHVLTYTGYTWEELTQLSQEQPAVVRLLQESHVLVDGPFLYQLKEYTLPFRGSSNQRMIDVARSLEENRVVLLPDQLA